MVAFIESIVVLHMHQVNETQLLIHKTLKIWRSNTAKKQKERENPLPETNTFMNQSAIIDRIDVNSFVVSSLAFLVFNAIYWLTFLVLSND